MSPVSAFRRAVSATRVTAAALCVAGALISCDSDGGTEGLAGPGAGVPAGASIFGIDDQNRLIAFGRQNPTAAVRVLSVTGLQAGETIVGIDFRSHAALPADRKLFAITSGSRLYQVDTTSGVATQIGAAAFTPSLLGASVGFDFNPQVDRIRLHTDQDQDLRLHPETGATAAVDTALTFTAGDINAGQNPAVAGTAYSNAVAGSTVTELFVIDSDRDVLATLTSPNSGRLTTRGALGVNTTSAVGFDIVGAGTGSAFAGTAFATLTPSGTSRSTLYTINLTTGTATLVGDVNYARALIGIAVAP